MNTVTLDTIVMKNGDIFTGSIDDEMVAMNIENGKYYQMNKTGSRLLSLLDKPCSIRALCEDVQCYYKVDADICKTDVIEFMQDMVQHKMVLVV